MTETADKGGSYSDMLSRVKAFRVSTPEEFRVGKRCLETPITKKVRFCYPSPSPLAGRGCLLLSGIIFEFALHILRTERSQKKFWNRVTDLLILIYAYLHISQSISHYKIIKINQYESEYIRSWQVSECFEVLSSSNFVVAVIVELSEEIVKFTLLILL